MNGNKAGNPGKIANFFVSTVSMVWGKKIVTFYWYSYMVLGKKFYVFIGTVGMKRGKELKAFMVQLARSLVQLAR